MNKTQYIMTIIFVTAVMLFPAVKLADYTMEKAEAQEILHQIEISNNPPIHYKYTEEGVKISFDYPNNAGSFEQNESLSVFNRVKEQLEANGRTNNKFVDGSGGILVKK